MSIKEEYKGRIEGFQKHISRIDKKFVQVSWLRLIAFLLAAVLIIYGIADGKYVAITGGILSFIIFVFLIRNHQKMSSQKAFLEHLVKINQDEYAINDRQFAAFDTGAEYIYKGHPYTRDLDLFGSFSVFQMLNRSFSKQGKDLLANWLNNMETGQESILQRQAAVHDLKERIDWCQHFRATGLQYGISYNAPEKIKEWASTSLYFVNRRGLYGLIYVLPVLTIASVMLAVFAVIPNFVAFMFLLAQLLLVNTHAKKVKVHHDLLNKRFGFVRSCRSLLQYIEQEHFTAENLKTLQNQCHDAGQKASTKIDKLATLLYYLDLRGGMLTGPVLNAILMWDLHCVYRLEKWLQANHDQVQDWFEAVNYMEVYISLAGYTFNNPEFSTPGFGPGTSYFLQAEQTGHPMIARNERVCNTFAVHDHSFAVITGSNMAGKSTFLRTIGINMVLASLGVNVCAASFHFRPVKLITGMRTEDSLVSHESLFYAELKRLKFINDELQKGEEVFVILDEILKGTNSNDKMKGSYAFVKKLATYNCQGIVATHDLVLGRLEDEVPGTYVNYHFDSIIEDEDVYYDYILKKGICANFNATQLMNRMGIL